MCRGNRKRDVTTMVTYSHATTPLGQSERAYYLSYFIKHVVYCFLACSPDGWSTEGCHAVKSTSSAEETECSCNHLTHFAVLLDYSDTNSEVS